MQVYGKYLISGQRIIFNDGHPNIKLFDTRGITNH